MRELLKLVVATAAMFAAMLWLLNTSMKVMPVLDPYAAYRSVWLMGLKGIFVSILMVGNACLVNWITEDNWWNQISEGNLAVGVTTAGLFIGIGLALGAAI